MTTRKMKLAGMLLLAAMTTTAHSATVVVTADRLLDVLSGKMVERPAVVIVDGRINPKLIADWYKEIFGSANL